MDRQRAGRRVLQALGLNPKRTAIVRQRKQAANVILTALLEAGMTQQQIADALSMSQAMISNSLRGKTTPTPAVLSCLMSLARERSIPLPEDLKWRPL